MPNHFHLLIRLDGGGPELSAFMRNIKSLSCRLIFPDQSSIWASRFDDVAVFSEEQFRVKLNYIHNNPVKAGLAMTAENYAYSSARHWAGLVSNGMVTTETCI